MNTTNTKGPDSEVRKNLLLYYILPLLSRGDLYGVIPSTTVLWPVHNPAFYSGLHLCQRRHHSL